MIPWVPLISSVGFLRYYWHRCGRFPRVTRDFVRCIRSWRTITFEISIKLHTRYAIYRIILKVQNLIENKNNKNEI